MEGVIAVILLSISLFFIIISIALVILYFKSKRPILRIVEKGDFFYIQKYILFKFYDLYCDIKTGTATHDATYSSSGSITRFYSLEDARAFSVRYIENINKYQEARVIKKIYKI